MKSPSGRANYVMLKVPQQILTVEQILTQNVVDTREVLQDGLFIINSVHFIVCQSCSSVKKQITEFCSISVVCFFP